MGQFSTEIYAPPGSTLSGNQHSYEAEGSTRYGVDMIADSFAVLAKAGGKPAEDDAGE